MLDLKSKYPDFYRFYGRRVAKKLSLKSLESIDDYFKSNSFDEEVINSFNERKSLKIDKKFQKIILEVGFGNGEFLIKQSNLNKKNLWNIPNNINVINDLDELLKKDLPVFEIVDRKKLAKYTSKDCNYNTMSRVINLNRILDYVNY